MAEGKGTLGLPYSVRAQLRDPSVMDPRTLAPPPPALFPPAPSVAVPGQMRSEVQCTSEPLTYCALAGHCPRAPDQRTPVLSVLR